MMLKVGTAAPDFDVTASSGQRLRLGDFLGNRNVVLFFYPKDFTTICTVEACGFRDMYEQITEKGAEVIGISLDTDDSHRRFAAEHRVKFPLVSDRDRSLTRSYGAISSIRSLLGLAKRLTFVIDKKGTIAGVFEGELSARPHLQGVRDLLTKLA
jgi:thioredoxin-dependent peroxiredoxin